MELHVFKMHTGNIRHWGGQAHTVCTITWSVSQ